MNKNEDLFGKSVGSVYILCMLVHVFYSVFGIVYKAPILTAYNLFSVFYFAGVYMLNKRGKFLVAITASVIEIMVYSFVMLSLLGKQAEFQGVLVTTVILVFTLPSTVKIKTKVIISSISAFAYILIQTRTQATPPIYEVSGFAMTMLKFINSSSAIVPVYFIMIMYEGFRKALEVEQHNMNKLLTSIKSIVSDTVENANLIENNIQIINSSVEKSNESIATIDTKSKHVLASQQNNAVIASSVMVESDKLKSENSELQSKTEVIISENKSVEEHIKNGSLKMEDVNTNVSELKENTAEMKLLIGEFFEAINEIYSSSKSIASVAEATNMLSLNAAIESARYQEAAGGFNIIASEIRNLAEQSKLSSNDIANTVEKITDKIAALVNSMENNDYLINNVFGAVETANDSFENMLCAIESVNESIKDINKLSENQDQSIAKILEVSSKLNETVDLTLSSCEDISTELSNQVLIENDIKDNMDSLNKIAIKLKETVEEI